MAVFRKEARAAAIAAIKAGVPLVASTRVTGARMFARNSDDLPAIEVSTPESQMENISLSGLVKEGVRLQVSILGTGDEVEDALDDIAAEVETPLRGDITLTALLNDFLTLGTQFFEGDGGEGRPARLDVTFRLSGKPRPQS